MNTTLKKGFTVRSATFADVEPLVTLLNTYYAAAGLNGTSGDDLRREFSMFGFDMANSTHIVETPDKHIAGFITIRDSSDASPVFPRASGCVHPDFAGQGIGSYLLAWVEERCRLAIDRVPAGIRVAMRIHVSSKHKPTVWLVEKHGMAPVRQSYYMLISLDKKIPEARWPEGITLKTFREIPDLRALWRANDEAFRDHWGHIPRNEDEAVMEIQQGISKDPLFDPSLWFLAVDGADIAGIALCRAAIGPDTDSGYVLDLGVRRPWRRRGIALNLLYYAFNELKDRGKKQVGLHVDAQSLTGATRLYLRAGMHVEQTIIQYEKELRSGRDISTQTL